MCIRDRAYAMSLAMFEFWMDVQDFRSEPDHHILVEMGMRIYNHFIDTQGSMCLSCFDATERKALKDALGNIKKESGETVREGRRLYDEAQAQAVKAIEEQCYSAFLASDHFSYILELKAKAGIYPGLPDFRLIRVLGQGGFGQVLEVVKRDCGKTYAMKVAFASSTCPRVLCSMPLPIMCPLHATARSWLSR